jgi:hypothetical protein
MKPRVSSICPDGGGTPMSSHEEETESHLLLAKSYAGFPLAARRRASEHIGEASFHRTSNGENELETWRCLSGTVLRVNTLARRGILCYLLARDVLSRKHYHFRGKNACWISSASSNRQCLERQNFLVSLRKRAISPTT